MSLTFIGVLLLLIGLPIVFYGGVGAVLALLIACSILGGASTINLTSLGGSSIPPIQFALLLAALRIFLPGSGEAVNVKAAIEANWALALYSVYGVTMALLGPRLFRGELSVPLLRTIPSYYIYAAQPLAPTVQNITTSVYLLGTLFCAIVVHVACNRRGGALALVRTGVVVATINIVLGILVAVTRDTAVGEVFALFRNGNYAQLDQNYRSFIRLSGLFPEPSSYATYSFGWFCFMFECWYRDVLPRRTGPVAFALFALLLASTSSSAYVGLAGFAALFALRMVLPGAIRTDKLTIMFLALLAGAMVAAMMVFIVPAAGAAFVDMVQYMTVAKGQTYSGLQRAFWARKGLEAFVASHGFGIGAGSFRSSSVATAIIGSTGVIGVAAVVIHLFRVIKPLHASTYEPVVDERTAIGAAAGWAAMLLLVPYSLILASCDLGTDFAIFAGAALALRAAPARRGARPNPTSAPLERSTAMEYGH